MASGRNIDAELLYHSCVDQFGQALGRLACAYESDPDLRRDLMQEIASSLWLSLRSFDGRCSLRTWAFRVAHNTASSHVARSLRHKSRNWVNLETVEAIPDTDRTEEAANQRILLDQLLNLIHRLNPVDRQVILLYLEGFDGKAIAEVTGISSSNVTTKVHRIKQFLVDQLRKGEEGNAPRSIRRRDANGVARAVPADDAAGIELTPADRT